MVKQQAERCRAVRSGALRRGAERPTVRPIFSTERDSDRERYGFDEEEERFDETGPILLTGYPAFYGDHGSKAIKARDCSLEKTKVSKCVGGFWGRRGEGVALKNHRVAMRKPFLPSKIKKLKGR